MSDGCNAHVMHSNIKCCVPIAVSAPVRKLHSLCQLVCIVTHNCGIRTLEPAFYLLWQLPNKLHA